MAAFTAGAGQIAIGEAVIFPPAAAVASDDLNEWNVLISP
jgi:hypothetical protein